MHTGLALLLVPTSLFSVALAAADCDRFSTNGSIAATYLYHRFYDFRNLHQSASGDAAAASSNGQSRIVSAAPWDSGWDARDWLRPASKEDTLDMQYAPSSVTISRLSSAASPFLMLTPGQPTTPKRRKTLPISPYTLPDYRTALS
jgi:hypothetical protein